MDKASDWLPSDPSCFVRFFLGCQDVMSSPFHEDCPCPSAKPEVPACVRRMTISMTSPDTPTRTATPPPKTEVPVTFVFEWIIDLLRGGGSIIRTFVPLILEQLKRRCHFISFFSLIALSGVCNKMESSDYSTIERWNTDQHKNISHKQMRSWPSQPQCLPLLAFWSDKQEFCNAHGFWEWRSYVHPVLFF